MNVSDNVYHKSLSALKTQLPRGYQRKIAETIEGITLQQVKYAFTGQLKDENKLIKILTCAQMLAKKHMQQRQNALKTTMDILSQNTGTALLFFVFI